MHPAQVARSLCITFHPLASLFPYSWFSCMLPWNWVILSEEGKGGEGGRKGASILSSHGDAWHLVYVIQYYSVIYFTFKYGGCVAGSNWTLSSLPPPPPPPRSSTLLFISFAVIVAKKKLLRLTIAHLDAVSRIFCGWPYWFPTIYTCSNCCSVWIVLHWL